MLGDIVELISKRKRAKEILGIAGNYSTRALKKKYRTMALRIHPDRNPEDKNSTIKMMELNEAYHILLNPESDAERHIKQFYWGAVI